MNLGHYLRKKRVEKKMSQFVLAEKLGYSSPQFISNWERTASYPPFDKYKQLCKLLDLDSKKIKNILLENYKTEMDRYF